MSGLGFSLGVGSGLFAAVDTEFGQDRRDVVVDRSRAEVQSCGAGVAVAVVGAAAAQHGEALAGAVGRRRVAKNPEGRQRGFEGADIAAELSQRGVVGAAAPRPFRSGGLPVPADLQVVGRDGVDGRLGGVPAQQGARQPRVPRGPGAGCEPGFCFRPGGVVVAGQPGRLGARGLHRQAKVAAFGASEGLIE